MFGLQRSASNLGARLTTNIDRYQIVGSRS